MRKVPAILCGIALGLTGAAIAPASAQTPSEDILVEGRYGRVPDSVRSLSQAVSYADLDLGTQAGRDELRHRLRLTARFLCDKLGEGDTASSGLVP